MAGLQEQARWENEIYRIEENDPVHGGENGITNKPIKQLANRTKYLKQEIEKRAGTEQVGRVQLTNDTGLDSESLGLTAKAGKILAQGIAALRLALNNYIPNSKKSDSTTSNSSDTVATSKAAKTAYDKGVSALNKANEVDTSTIKKTGSLQHIEGRLRINGVTGSWSGIEFGTEQGFWRFEGHPNSHNEQDRRANLFFKNNEGRSFYLSFPTIGNGQTVAYQSWVNNALSGKVNKAGDTMTGNLVVPYLRAMGGYISTTAKNADFAGLDIIREGSSGTWLSRIEALPDKRWKFWTQDGYDVFIPTQSGTVALEDNVVRKAGDVMAGDLEVPYLKVQRDNAWVNIVSRANSRASLDYSVNTDRVAQASVTAVDVGGYGVELQFLTTPQGDNYDTDRRHHVMTIGHGGHIWAKQYGWLHDYFVRREDFVRSWYPNHYAGTEVYKIRHLGLMITVMNTQGGNQEFILPEAYTGHAIVLATDRGGGHITVESNQFLGENRIRVGGYNDTHCSVLVIGMKDF